MNVHVLNGDALLDRFPSSIPGERIVMRECLVEGDISGDSLESFFINREKFLTNNFDEGPDYIAEVAPQIKSIASLSSESNLYLWFEDDLFCQVNLWFICSLLVEKNLKSVSLVRPENNLQYGFGGLSSEGLVLAFQDATSLSENDITHFSNLWGAYRSGLSNNLAVLSSQTPNRLRFIVPAIDVAIARIEQNEPLGTIKNIIEELEEPSFVNTFKEFYRKHPIYGFGDAQVKRLYDQIISNS